MFAFAGKNHCGKLGSWEFTLGQLRSRHIIGQNHQFNETSRNLSEAFEMQLTLWADFLLSLMSAVNEERSKIMTTIKFYGTSQNRVWRDEIKCYWENENGFIDSARLKNSSCTHRSHITFPTSSYFETRQALRHLCLRKSVFRHF